MKGVVEGLHFDKDERDVFCSVDVQYSEVAVEGTALTETYTTIRLSRDCCIMVGSEETIVNAYERYQLLNWYLNCAETVVTLETQEWKDQYEQIASKVVFRYEGSVWDSMAHTY